MTTLRHCTRCSELIVSGDRFCPRCGAEQPAASGADLSDAQVARWEEIEKRLRVATEGRYTIRGLIGRGGMAAVYLADWPQMELRVAIKVMDPYLLTQETFVQRFLQEARTIARLRHRHIIRVYDSGQAGDLYYFCMDYLSGRSMEKVIAAEGPLPIPVVKTWLWQAADALGYAHRQAKPIVHRDVKPSNIILDHEGEVVLTDFGIAKVRDTGQTLSTPSLTMPGSVLGTPVYLSPEQASVILNPREAAAGSQASSASDQYSLGVVAYEMLTGAPPFTGDLAPLLLAHAETGPTHVLEKRPDCPPELAEAVMRMLAKKPEERWPSMHHLCAQLAVASPPPGDPLRVLMEGFARGYRAVGSVELKPPSGEIFEGLSFRVAATPLDLGGQPLRGRPVSWRSSDPDIALVTEDGHVTTLRSGPVAITATVDGVSGEILLAVAPVPVETVVLVPNQLQLQAGAQRHLRTLLFSREGRELADREMRWSTSDPGVAEVSEAGTVTALRPGEAVITVSCEGRTARATLTVTPVPVAAVEISPSALTLEVGEEVRLGVVLRDADGEAMEGRPVSWTTDGPTVAGVTNEGMVKGLQPGHATVTAECGTVSGRATLTVTPEKVATVRVSTSQVDLEEGDSLPLGATALSARGAELPGRPVRWESDNPDVAEVEAEGVVWGIQAGSATVRAVCEGKSASIRVAVASAPVLSLEIVPATVSLPLGSAFRLHAIPRGKEGRELALRPVAWASSDAGVVTAREEGLIMAVAEGEASVLAECQGRSASARVVVLPAPLAAIELPERVLTLEVGDSTRLQPVLKGSDGKVLTGRPLNWSSSDPEVIRVDGEGSVTGLTEGTAVLTVAAEGISLTVSATVRPEGVASLEVTPERCELEEGGTGELTAVLRGKSGRVLSGRPVRWVSDHPEVVDVTEGGDLRARSPGTATISAACQGATASSSVTVRATPVASLEVAPPALTLAAGETGRLRAIPRSAAGAELRGRAMEWSSGDPSLARVSGEGKVTALNPGPVVITAACEGRSASASLTIAPEKVASLALDAPRSSLKVGEMLELRCRPLGGSGRELPGREVRWASNRPEVASIDLDGRVRGVAAGRVSVTAECEGERASLELLVHPPAVAAVRLEPEELSLLAGESSRLRAVVEDETGQEVSDPPLAWSSSNPKVARVGREGGIEGVEAGSALIRATCQDRWAEVTVTVRPVPVASLEVVLEKPRIRVKGKQQVKAVPLGADGRPLPGRRVSWVSSDPAVARVDDSGRVQGLSPGSARLRASCEGVEESVTLAVEAQGRKPGLWLAGAGALAVIVVGASLLTSILDPSLPEVPEIAPTPPRDEPVGEVPARAASIALLAEGDELTVGQEIRLEAVVRDASGTLIPGRPVVWRSSDAAIATVTGEGERATVVGRGPGRVEITASADEVSGMVAMAVVAAEAERETPQRPTPEPEPPRPRVPTAIRVAPGQGEMEVGETLQLQVTDQGGGAVTGSFRSSDPSVASVSGEGLVRALGPGTVTVTAMLGELRAEATLRVRARPQPEPPPRPTLTTATLDSIRGTLTEVGGQTAQADFGRAYGLLDQVQTRIQRLRTQFGEAPALGALEEEYLEAFRATWARCVLVRRIMLERGEGNPPVCREPPRGGGHDPS